jgi:hypothetical protein
VNRWHRLRREHADMLDRETKELIFGGCTILLFAVVLVLLQQ